MNSESRMADGILTRSSFPRASYLIQCEVLSLTRARKTHDSTLLTLPVPLSSPVTVCFQQPETRCSISWYGRRFFSLWESAQLSHLLVGVLVWISLLEHTLSDMIFLLYSPVRLFILFPIQCCCYWTPFSSYRSFCSLSPLFRMKASHTPVFLFWYRVPSTSFSTWRLGSNVNEGWEKQKQILFSGLKSCVYSV